MFVYVYARLFTFIRPIAPVFCCPKIDALVVTVVIHDPLTLIR